MTPLLRFVPAALLGFLIFSGCGPSLVPVTENGQLLPDRTTAIVVQGRADAEMERGRLADERTLTAAGALATCAPEVCDAVTRGELAIGMTEAQVLAATRTTGDAWDVRDSGGMTLMTTRPGRSAPGDAVGEIVTRFEAD